MCFVYILRCKDNSFYVGITWNLKKRLFEHNAGIGCNYTKARMPVKLIYSEEYKDKYTAAEREKELKGWSRRKKEQLINGLH